jgi:hypothetical protein
MSAVQRRNHGVTIAARRYRVTIDKGQGRQRRATLDTSPSDEPATMLGSALIGTTEAGTADHRDDA